MTEIKEEIPCCENCPTIKCFHHPNHWKTSSQCWSRNDHINVWDFTKEHSCLSHPGVRAYLNKDAIDKMGNMLDEFGDNTTPYAEGYTDALIAISALMRGDGKCQ